MGSRHHHLPHTRATPRTLAGASAAETTTGATEGSGCEWHVLSRLQTNTASEGPRLGWAGLGWAQEQTPNTASEGPRLDWALRSRLQTNTASEGPGLGWAPGWIPGLGQRWGPRVSLFSCPVWQPQPWVPRQLTRLPGRGPGPGRNPVLAHLRNRESAAPCCQARHWERPDEGGGQRAGMGIIWVPVGPQLGGSGEPGCHRFRKGKGGGLGPAGVGVPAHVPASRMSHI